MEARHSQRRGDPVEWRLGSRRDNEIEVSRVGEKEGGKMAKIDPETRVERLL